MAGRSSALQGRTVAQVLLVDDNPLQLSTRQAILRRAHVDVHMATTAQSALALLRAHSDQIRLVITDHVMPETSGAVFVRMLREITPDLPVIVISGMAEAEEEYAGMNVTFRNKPIQPEAFIELVRGILGAA